MHSTVQTGLFTPNIYNCEHNMYSPNAHSRSSNQPYHLPAHHHHQLNYQRTHVKDASVHSSLLGINVLHGSHSDGLNKHDTGKNNLSASNITFSSNKNLSSVSNLKRKESSISSSSINKLSVRNLNDESVRLSMDNVVSEKNFWNYTKPCGILTLFMSFVLLMLSLVCFVLVFSKYVCRMANTCSNAVVILGAVSFLVIGIVMIFFGMVIVIYSKKDSQAKVIVTRASQFDRHRDHAEPSKNNNGSLPLLGQS